MPAAGTVLCAWSMISKSWFRFSVVYAGELLKNLSTNEVADRDTYHFFGGLERVPKYRNTVVRPTVAHRLD